MAVIFPSLISADQLNLERVIKELNPHVHGYHLDIMDNHFVPNLTWGPLVINSITKATNKQLWIHLMVENPLPWLDMLDLPTGSIVSFHFESEGNIAKTIAGIKERKWEPSIALNPETEIKHALPSLENNSIRHVLLMSVKPGFAGQLFMPEVIEKLKALNGYRQTSSLDFIIGMDGGIDQDNIAQLVEYGVDHLAIASAIFKHSNPVGALEKLQELANK